jgi:hypothetical protein
MCFKTQYKKKILRRKPTNIPHLVLRPKLRNHRGDFEIQITKPSTLRLGLKPRNRHDNFDVQIIKPLTLVLRPKPRNCRSGFEVKPLTNYRHQF